MKKTKIRWFLTKKCLEKDPNISNSVRNCKRIYAGNGDSDGPTAISSQLHTVHTYESHHTKGEHLNSLIKAAVPTFHKRPHLTPTLKVKRKSDIG